MTHHPHTPRVSSLRAATDRQGDTPCPAGLSHSATTHGKADAAPDRLTPPTHRARHLISWPTLGDWIGGIALCAIFVELMFLPLIFG